MPLHPRALIVGALCWTLQAKKLEADRKAAEAQAKAHAEAQAALAATQEAVQKRKQALVQTKKRIRRASVSLLAARQSVQALGIGVGGSGSPIRGASSAGSDDSDGSDDDEVCAHGRVLSATLCVACSCTGVPWLRSPRRCLPWLNGCSRMHNMCPTPSARLWHL